MGSKNSELTDITHSTDLKVDLGIPPCPTSYNWNRNHAQKKLTDYSVEHIGGGEAIFLIKGPGVEARKYDEDNAYDLAFALQAAYNAGNKNNNSCS